MSAHKERPILFSAPMVRAILKGRKTQTRRIVKGDATAERMDSFFTTFGANGYMFFGPEHEATFPSREAFRQWVNKTYPETQWTICPYGKPGERLWVRETWSHDAANVEQCRVKYEDAMGGCVYGPYYRATDGAPDTLRWIPSIHMPRWASRINLGITSVRVERLQDISRGDCMAEGCPFPNMAESDPKKWYADLWDSFNGDGAWDKNPWVWVVEFKRVAQP